MPGWDWVMVEAVAWSLDGVRPARMRSLGVAGAMCSAKRAPRPEGEAPVMRMVLPAIAAWRSWTRVGAVVEVLYFVDMVVVVAVGVVKKRVCML